MTSPINSTIDAACGVTPEMRAKWRADKELDEKREAIVYELISACELWYQDGRKHHARLKKAIAAMLADPSDKKQGNAQ